MGCLLNKHLASRPLLSRDATKSCEPSISLSVWFGGGGGGRAQLTRDERQPVAVLLIKESVMTARK